MEWVGGFIAFVVIFWLHGKLMSASARARHQDRFDAMFGYGPRRRK